MATYNKKLKRGKDGVVVRYIGRNQKGVPEKFRLGYDLTEAERRSQQIAALWAELEGQSYIEKESRSKVWASVLEARLP